FFLARASPTTTVFRCCRPRCRKRFLNQERRPGINRKDIHHEPCGSKNLAARGGPIMEDHLTRVPAWFERKFDFTFPVEHYPNLCVRLRGTPARLKEMLRGVPGDVLVRRRGDKWSPQEHAGHLLDLEPLWMARLEDFLRDGDTLTVADLSNRKTHE